jgi:hypothetical protein
MPETHFRECADLDVDGARGRAQRLAHTVVRRGIAARGRWAAVDLMQRGALTIACNPGQERRCNAGDR